MLQVHSVTFHNADGTTTDGEVETDAALPTAEGWAITPNATGGYDAVPVNAPPPVAATPTFSPAAGTYSGAQSVTLSDTTPGAVIHYTTDGTTPMAISPAYSGPIAVSASETIQAIAVAPGFTNSVIASAAYVISVVAPTQVADPVFSPAAPGPYGIPLKVTIADATPAAEIYYRMDGGVPAYPPTGNTLLYNPATGVVLNSTVYGGYNMNAMAVAPGLKNSAVVNANYKLTAVAPPPPPPPPAGQAAAPTFSPPGGSYPAAQSPVVKSATPGATIYYTNDDTAPIVP
jgi:hypothetical protein